MARKHKECKALLLAALLSGLPCSGLAMESVLERILRTVVISGLFVNGAENNLSGIGGGIDAHISNILSPSNSSVVTDTRDVVQSLYLTLGNMDTTAIGASNAGRLVLGVIVRPGLEGSEESTSGIPKAAIVLFGQNFGLQQGIDIALTETGSAFNRSTEVTSWPRTNVVNTATIALNYASQSGEVNAKILNHVRGATLRAGEMTTTAIGTVNSGLTVLERSLNGLAEVNVLK